MENKVMTIAAMALAMSLASCHTSKNVQKDNTHHMAASYQEELIDPGYLILSDQQRVVIDKNNEFALNLFREISGFDSKVISPMSISYLMGMLANGAEGKTREEIMKTIGCEDVPVEELNAFYGAMMQMMPQFDKTTTIDMANYVALNKHFDLKKSFVDALKNNYVAGVENMDFASPSAVKRINQWCSDHTQGMIPSIIDQLDPSTMSCIMNAIYFKGTWAEKFDKKNTKLENFRGYTRDIKKAQMMHREGKCWYVSHDTFAAVSMPYGNGNYAMTVLLPNENSSISEMMKLMDGKTMSEINRKMENCIVDLKLPRFTCEVEQSLNDVIGKLGAPTMFTSGADFSNMANENLAISKMLQKAKIEVSEEGTKAAAVTAGMVALTALRPDEPRHVQFHANHPFVYMITENTTGAVLFMGQFTGSEL